VTSRSHEAPETAAFATASTPVPPLEVPPVGVGLDPLTAAGAAPHSLVRTFRAFAVARVLLGILLLGIQASIAVVASTTLALDNLIVLAIHVLLACGLLAWATVPWVWRLIGERDPISPRGYLRRSWALASIGVDVVFFSVLLLLSGVHSNASALFFLPVLMAAVLVPRRTALAVASAVVLVLLLHAWWLSSAGVDAAFLITQAGITGTGMLLIAVLTGELADRLARQERATRSSLVLARQQALLNRLMIEEMQDGVMVVDRLAVVRAANPAALALIGVSPPAGFVPVDLNLRPEWHPLCVALQRAYATGDCPESGEELSLTLRRGEHVEHRSLRLRMRFTRRHGPESGEELCLLFVDDVRTLRARARQEQLAAMGRVSAGIAHEIRNPLAAIAQANALLGEDLQDATHQRLVRMVADNVDRLQRIVVDVLDVVPGVPREASLLDLCAQCRLICEEWKQTAGLVARADLAPLYVDVGAEVMWVRFEMDHLRRILVNLLDNALRHCSGQSHALWVRLAPVGAKDVQLSVASDGAPIAPDVEPYLFEPFFSTRSRGSGLGLYICRELCERYGAAIEFRPRGPGARHRNVFVITLPRVKPTV
jgi:two-component system sensor histidine kinase PilS (NtrC family)